MAELENRLGEVEKDVIDLKQSVATINTQVNGISDGQGILIKSLQELRKEVNSSQKTDWGTIAGVGLFFLTLFGGSFAYIISEISAESKRIDSKATAAFELIHKEKDQRHSLEVKILERELQEKIRNESKK